MLLLDVDTKECAPYHPGRRLRREKVRRRSDYEQAYGIGSKEGKKKSVMASIHNMGRWWKPGT